MGYDFSDIYNYFLNKEKEKKKRDGEVEEPSVGLHPDDNEEENISESEFFIRNFEKYTSFNKGGEESIDGASRQKKKNRASLKSGSPSAIIDLHGKTIKEALSVLERFLSELNAKNVPLALIIVGKGIHSEGGKSILKDSVTSWLPGDGKRFISSFKSAPRRYGGSGAIMVSLKKR